MKNQAYQLPLKNVGEDVIIWEKAQIIGAEQIEIHHSVIIDDFTFIMGGQRMQFGSFIHVGAHTSIVGGGEFFMADFAGLSGGVRVYTGNEDYLGGSLTNPAVPAPFRFPIQSVVRIEKHAIVGANAVILPGVTIGEGAVVGALSMVSKDVSPWTINVGSPCRKVGERPRDRILELEAQLRGTLFDSTGRYIPRTKARDL